MTDKLLLPLTRALLRTSRQYDKNPSLKVLLATSRRLGYDMISADWLPNPTEVPTAPNDIAGKVCGDMTTEVCHGARLFTGDEGNGPTVQQALSGAHVHRDVLLIFGERKIRIPNLLNIRVR